MLSLLHGTDLIVISSHQFGSMEIRTSAIMNLMVQGRRVFFFNKPIIGMTKTATFYYSKEFHKVTVVQPYLPADVSIFDREDALVKLVQDFMKDEHITDFSIWTDTPKGMPLIRKLNPKASVYDRVQIYLNDLEVELLKRADIILNTRVSMFALEFEIDKLNADHVEASVIHDSSSENFELRHISLNHTPRQKMISRYQAG